MEGNKEKKRNEERTRKKKRKKQLLLDHINLNLLKTPLMCMNSNVGVMK